MCTTCGCSDNSNVLLTPMPVQAGESGAVHFHQISSLDSGGEMSNGHHVHLDLSDERDADTLKLEADILGKNDRIAEDNRERFSADHILALNLVSSPGSGKTSLLERTIRELSDEVGISVIEGDQQTLLDAERIQATGCKVVQLNTGAGCHLEADMLARAIEQLQPEPNSVVMIENVGNLVCPALFDLGEEAKVAVLSVTEGEDKPLKYPHMFRAASLMIINKIDLLPYVNFNVDKCIDYARQVNPDIQVITLSVQSGEGMADWYQWLKDRQGNLLAHRNHSGLQQEASL